MKEIWKPILGLDEEYEVSNFGNVRSLSRIVYRGKNSVPSRLTTKVLKTTKHRKGYLVVNLYWNKFFRHQYVHRLVAETFLSYKKDCVVNHIDGNKENNHSSNLEWCTLSENTKHWHDSIHTLARKKKKKVV
jgi:hypothetical protein